MMLICDKLIGLVLVNIENTIVCIDEYIEEKNEMISKAYFCYQFGRYGQI